MKNINKSNIVISLYSLFDGIFTMLCFGIIEFNFVLRYYLCNKYLKKEKPIYFNYNIFRKVPNTINFFLIHYKIQDIYYTLGIAITKIFYFFSLLSVQLQTDLQSTVTRLKVKRLKNNI